MHTRTRRAAYLAAALSAFTAIHEAQAGADGVNTTAAAAADRGYRDGLGANKSSDHEGGLYGRKGAARSAYDKGWNGGVYRNGFLDALRDFFARGLKYERNYQYGYEDGRQNGGSADYEGDHTQGGAGPK